MSHSSPTAPTPLDEVDTPEEIGTPVESSRQWTTGLAPNGDGWNYIAQGYLYPSESPTEWAVVSLETGAATIYEGPTGYFANVVYSADHAEFAGDQRQLRASDGRIYWPLRYTRIAYYDPADQQVKHLSAIVDPVNDANPLSPGNEIMRAAVFGQDGHIYGSTQVRGSAGFSPMVWRLKTTNQDRDIIGYVGNPQTGPTYGYYVAVDVTPDGSSAFGRIYVAVGQDPWELWQLNIQTGEADELTPDLVDISHIEFNQRAEGWEAAITHSGGLTRYWVANGDIFAGAPTHNPGDFTACSITPAGPTLLVDPPELDLTLGFGRVAWRQDAGEWTTIEYDYSYREPVNVESLTPIPNTTAVLGNTAQYQGWFRTDGATTTNYGASGILSQPVTCVVDDTIYMSGYPNCRLYAYDPTADWTTDVNPDLLGDWFATSNAKYCYFLQHCASNGRIYMTGRRERNGNGSGIGYYDIDGATFDGHYDTPLNFYDPRGFVIMGDRIVFSGEVHADPDDPGAEPDDASLLIYDMDLTLVTSHVVQVGMTDTGLLFDSGAENIVVGINTTTAYRFNISTGVLLSSVALGGTLGPVTQRSDKSIWLVIDGALKRLNATSLATTTHATVTGADYLAWQDDELFYSVDADVSAANRLGGHRTAFASTEPTLTGHLSIDAAAWPAATGHRSKT